MLYCPGNDDRKLRKLASLDLDCAVLDCEDGVALSKKVGHTPHHTHTRTHVTVQLSGSRQVLSLND